MRELRGKTIKAVYRSDDKAFLRIDTKGGAQYLYRAEGECCSHSWIENVDIYGTLGVVTKTEVVSLDTCEIEGDTIRFDLIRIYMYRGSIEIDFRNSSNGYYSGSLEPVRSVGEEVKWTLV